jgi:hypothetical protein
VASDVGQTQGARILDQHPKDAPPPRELADRSARLLGYAERDETFEVGALLIEHTKGRVPRAGESSSLLENLLEHRLGVQLRYELAPDAKEPAELLFG